jgi:hypothetical protein
MLRILKNKPFSQWAKKLKIDDKTLLTAINEMTHGLYEANLGGHIYKKRLPLGAKGKSGGARTIIAFKAGNKAIFVYGFSKGEKSNITKKEEDSLKDLAKIYFSYDDDQISKAIKAGILTEAHTNEKIYS